MKMIKRKHCSKEVICESYSKRQFCTMDCKNDNQKRTKIGNCLCCNKEIVGTVNYPRKYCSFSCSVKNRIKSDSGRVTFKIGQRKRIIEKYGSNCLYCGKGNYDPNPLHVHHLDDNAMNTIDDNLIPLCMSCHRKTQRNIKGKESYISQETLKEKITNFINKY